MISNSLKSFNNSSFIARVPPKFEKYPDFHLTLSSKLKNRIKIGGFFFPSQDVETFREEQIMRFNLALSVKLTLRKRIIQHYFKESKFETC